MRWKRSHDHPRPSELDHELAVLKRTGRPVIVRCHGEAVAALITLDDLREHLGSTPEISVGDAAPEVKPRPVPRPAPAAGKLEALRELRELAIDSD